MTFELIGTPRIENEYCDAYETTMVCDLRRDDGVEGDVWIVAGVPDYQRGSSNAAHTQHGYCRVRVFGDSPDYWCPKSFLDDDLESYAEVRDAVIEACETAALAAHQSAMDARENAE